MLRLAFIALAIASLTGSLVGCASGGGGGGGGGMTSPPPGPPPPPPPPPPPLTYNGPTAGLRLTTVSDSDPHVASIPIATIENVSAGAVLQIQLGNPAIDGDETYRLIYSEGGLALDRQVGPAGATDLDVGAWGNSRTYTSGALTVDIFDLSTSLTGALTYIAPVRVHVGSGFEYAGDTVFGVFGQETGAFNVLPSGYVGETGYATFEGATVGYYRDSANALWRTGGDLDLIVNFTSGNLVGYARNFNAVLASGASGVLADHLDFSFSLDAEAFASQFTAAAQSEIGGPQLVGSVEGTFFGEPNVAPDEVGVSYQLGDANSGPFLIGIGAAGYTPPPPPPPPPLGPYHGPSVILNVDIGTPRTAPPSAFQPIDTATLYNVEIDIGVSLDIGSSTDSPIDDHYFVHLPTVPSLDLSGGFNGDDGLGVTHSYTKALVFPYANFDIYDLSGSMSGALDYVEMARYERQLDDDAYAIAFLTFGTEALRADLPISGTGVFAGGTRGYYQSAVGDMLRTASDLAVSVNFGTGAVTGSTSNFRLVNSAQQPVTTPLDLNFSFTGSMDSGTAQFSGTAANVLASDSGGLGLSGDVEGAFFGPAGQTPDELGMSYMLGAPGGAILAGVGIAEATTAPPPPPPRTGRDCATSPTAIGCSATPTQFRGPSSLIRTDDGAPAIAPTIIAASIENVLPDVRVVVDPGATPDTDDDVYTLTFNGHGSTYAQTFSNFLLRHDGLGRVLTATADQGGLGSAFTLFDLPTSLNEGFDYVQLARLDREIGGIGDDTAFFVFGRQSLIADLPTTGAGFYRGGTRGLYRSADGQVFQTAGDATIGVYFAADDVSGTAYNFSFSDLDGNVVARSELLDFTFAGTISVGSTLFAGPAQSTPSGIGVQGRIEGALFGAAGESPSNIGFVYALGSTESGAYMNGGAALGLAADFPAPPPAPPPGPPPPPAGSCEADPAQLQCSTGPWTATGPFIHVFPGNTNLLTTGLTLTVELGNPANPSDDIYRFTSNSPAENPSFTGLVNTSDVLGDLRTGTTQADGKDWALSLFDVSTTLSGSLDYVQIGLLRREIAGADAGLDYFVLGPATDAGSIPTTGRARFDGGTRGVYIAADDNVFETTSDITMSVNFSTRSITGAATNFSFMDQSGALVTRSESADFTFTASISNSVQFFGSGASSGLGISGNVYGRFFGDPEGPTTEAGLAYTFGSLDDTDDAPFLAGAGALGLSE